MNRLSQIKTSKFAMFERVDNKHLRDLMGVDGGQGAVLQEMLQVFLEVRDEKLRSLKAALAGRDAQAIHREMHSFKVSCHNVGAFRASMIAKEIQRLAELDSVSFEDLSVLLHQLETEIAAALDAVGEFLRRRSIGRAA